MIASMKIPEPSQHFSTEKKGLLNHHKSQCKRKNTTWSKMSPRPMWLALLVLLVGAADVAAEVLATTHFDKFFPDWDP